MTMIMELKGWVSSMEAIRDIHKAKVSIQCVVGMGIMEDGVIENN